MSTLTMNKPHADAKFWDRIAARYSRKDVPDQAAYETKLAKTNALLKPDDRVLEIGCGTGTTALHHAPRVRHILATDISEKAIELARRNRDAAAVADKVDLRRGSLFEPVDDETRFDVIVSNPPYVAEVDEASLEPEVRDWEPREALFAGHDGLDVIRRLIDEAPQYLKAGGLIALEVGADQPRRVAELMRSTGRYDDVRIVRDYSGRERFVLAHGI